MRPNAPEALLLVPCEDCKCAQPENAQVSPTCRREGMTALVIDAPNSAASIGRTVFNGPSGEVLAATIRAVLMAAGRQPPPDLLDEVSVFYAVARSVPGGKKPSIAAVRACHDRLVAELSDSRPRMVLSIGPQACATLAGVGLPELKGRREIVDTPITKWRGQMRWLALPSGDVPWVATISPGSVLGKQDFYRDLSADVWKTWTQPAPLPAPDVETHVPRDLESLRAALALLDGASVISCDIETLGLRPWADGMLSVGFGADYGDNSGVAVIVPYELLDDPDVKDLCWDYVYSSTRKTVFQNGKFDMAFLSTWFDDVIPREAVIADTLLLGSLLDERPRKDRMGSLGLKEQASYRYDQQDYHWDWMDFYERMRHDGTHPDCGTTPPTWVEVTEDGRTPRWCDVKCKFPHPDEEERANWDGLYGYQALDVYYTTRLWFDLVAEAEAESPRLLQTHDEVMIPAAKVLSACELLGAPLDRAWLLTYAAWLRRRIGRRELALAVVARRLGAPEDFSHGSPGQVADLMYDDWSMTPDVRKKFRADGKADRSTDKEHIEAAILKYDRPTADPAQRRGAKWLRTLLRWRTEAKQLSTYSESVLEAADADDRVHASFWLHGTVTGRLSSSQPNLQNVPAVDDKTYEGDGRTVYTLRGGAKTRWPARRAYAPGPGRVWVEADFSQLELRVAAAISGDTRLRQVFVDERDIHREVAAEMFSKAPEDITKPERYLAKAVDFGLLYGRTGKALSEGAEMDFYEHELGGRRWDAATADAFIAKFLRGFPQLGAWLRSNADDAVRDHYVETPLGRRRRFPFTPRTKWERLAIERQANNAPIQGTASDLCLQAMWRIAPRLPEGAVQHFPVHDSICLTVREDLLEEVTAILREEMEIPFLGVPITIDVESGPSWADVH